MAGLFRLFPSSWEDLPLVARARIFYRAFSQKTSCLSALVVNGEKAVLPPRIFCPKCQKTAPKPAHLPPFPEKRFRPSALPGLPNSSCPCTKWLKMAQNLHETAFFCALLLIHYPLTRIVPHRFVKKIPRNP